MTRVFDLIAASGPAPGHERELALYGRLVGSWSIECEWFSRSGGVSVATGSWHFAWILGGLGIQDVLGADGAPPTRLGTTIRCFDPSTGLWHVTWMQASSGEFVSLLGRADGNDIVQESIAQAGSPPMRWSFRDITNDSFVWLGEVLDPDGSWFLEQRMIAKRI